MFDNDRCRWSELVLLSVVLSFPLTQMAVVPALPNISAVLGRPPSETVWVMSAFLIASAILAPLIGGLGDRFGKQKLLSITLVTVLLGGLLAANAGQLWLVVVGRCFQGAVGGVFPLCFALTRTLLPIGRQARIIGSLTAVAGLGAGLGLLFGGVLVDVFSYRAVFWFNSGYVALVLVVVRRVLQEPSNRLPAQIDFPGAMLLGGGVFALMLGISDMRSLGPGIPQTPLVLGGGILALATFVIVERRSLQPLVDMRLHAHHAVLATNVAAFLVSVGGFSVFVLAPQYAQTRAEAGYGFGSTATEVGLFMLPGAVLMLWASPLVGGVGRRLGHSVTLMCGALLVAGGMTGLAWGPSNLVFFFIFVGVSFIGLNLSFAAMTNLLIQVAPTGQAGECTGTNALVRSVGNALGAQVSAGIVGASILPGYDIPSAQGYSFAFNISAFISLLAAGVASWLAWRSRREGNTW